MNFQDMEYGDLIKHVEESIRALRLRAYKEGYEQGRFDERIKGSGSEQYQQQRRDEIVERAKRDVEVLVDRGKDASLFNDTQDGNETYRRHFYAVEFHVNKEKRTVVALIRHRSRFNRVGVLEKIKHRGIAKCAPQDCFNVHIGKAIALRRALGLQVPEEYLNAPQPTEVRVGDFIFAMGKVRKVVSSDDEVCVYTNPPTCNIKSKMTTSLLERIIDDSREGVAELES